MPLIERYPCASSIIERPHLVDRALDANVTVVSAPPGFGKTQFLVEVARKAALRGFAIRTGNTRAISLQPAIARGTAPSVGGALWLIDDALIERTDSLVDELRKFIADDATVVIATRSRALPGLLMAAIPTNGVVISENDLRLSCANLAALTGFDSSNPLVRDLERLSAGWPLGLRLIRNELVKLPNQRLADVPDNAMVALVTYFESLGPFLDDKELEAAASILELDEASASLINLVFSDSSIATTLRSLVSKGGFVTESADGRGIFSVEPMFERYLRLRYSELGSLRVDTEGASVRLARLGHVHASLRLAAHSRKSGVLQEIVRDMGGIRLPMTVPYEITHSLAAITMRAGSNQIDLLVARIFIALVQGQISHAVALLEHSERQWPRQRGVDRLKIETIRLIVQYHRGLAIAIRDINRIEHDYAEILLGDPFAQAILHQVRCAAYFAFGEYDLIAKSSLYVHETSVALKTPLLDDFRLVNLAVVDFRLGRPAQAADILRNVISNFERTFGQGSHQASYVCLLLARVLMEKLDFAEGERLFNDNCHAAGLYPGWQPGMELILEARIEIACRSGGVTSALDSLNTWEASCEPGLRERFSYRIALFKVQLLLRCGRLAEADRELTAIRHSLLGRREGENRRTMDELSAHILSARLKVENGCGAAAGRDFEARDFVVTKTGDVFLKLRANIVVYRCQSRAQRFCQARATLAKILAFASGHGLFLTLLGEWSAVDPDDSAALVSGPLQPQERALLDILRAQKVSCTDIGEEVGRSPLSRRERQILGFLAEGMSSKEMATILDLSIGTIKGYRRRLYEKLRIYRRSEAVRAAHTFINTETTA